jgi:prevent-host-death family protein
MAIAIGHIITPAGEFKQKCLAILDAVAAGSSYVITKRGKPVARLMPVEDPQQLERDILASLREDQVSLPESNLVVPSSTFVAWSTDTSLDPQTRKRKRGKRARASKTVKVAAASKTTR